MNIVYLREYKKKVAFNHGIVGSVGNECKNAKNWDAAKWTFAAEKHKLLNSLATQSHLFMFPTVLSNFRRNINPVLGLYEYTEMVLLTYDDSDLCHRWCVSLFSNAQWKLHLVASICQDEENIAAFVSKWGSRFPENSSVKEDLACLSNMHGKLKNALVTFHKM